MSTPSVISSIGTQAPVLTEEQKKTVVPEVEQWDDSRAAAIAIGDFRKAEAYRSRNHDIRYQTADQLYLAWVRRNTWEGTKIPRSSVAVHLVFDQVEGMLPSLVGAMFPDEGDLPFSAEPQGQTTLAEATATRDLLCAQLRNLGDRSGLSARELYRRHAKGRLIYGNAVTEFGWLKKQDAREVYTRQSIPMRMPIPHPVTGAPVMVPTGQMMSQVSKSMQTVEINKPHFLDHDIRDFYWDPNCRSHNIQDAGHCEVRSYMTINQLLGYANTEGFMLPKRGGPGSSVATDVLLELARNKPMTQADNTKRQTEVFRGMSWQPYIDESIDPNLARVEVIRYWQKNRHVWIVRNYSQPLYNQPNCYGVLPFLTSVYVDVPGRWAGMGLPDLVETDQKLVETILNARLDELALLIHPPIIKKRGVALPLSQQRMRPGLMWESDDPKNDFVKMEMGNVTAQAFVEVEAAERRAQKTGGVTDLAVLGSPSSGGNSANRTATGIQSQGAASSKRMQYQVENDEDWLIVPMLQAMHAMNQKFLDPNEMMQILGPEGQAITYDPVDILNASVRFKITASGRMRQKAALQSGGMAVLAQTFLNPELISLMMQLGLKPNVPGFVDLMTDTLNIPKQTLYIPASPQEQQAWQQQQQAPDMMRMQMQRERIDGQGARQEEKDESQLLMTLLKLLVTPQVAHEGLNRLLGTKLDTHTGKEPQPKKPNGD